MVEQLLKTVGVNLLDEHPVIVCPICKHVENIDKNREDEEYLESLGLFRKVAVTKVTVNSPMMYFAKCNACQGKFVVRFDMEEELW